MTPSIAQTEAAKKKEEQAAKKKMETQALIIVRLNEGSPLQETLFQLSVDKETFTFWRHENQNFDRAITKYLEKKIQEPFDAKYCQLLKDEFASGGCNRTFAEKYDLPLAKILDWENSEKEFMRAHDEAIAENVPAICQLLLDHMAGGLSIRTFPAAIGEFPAVVLKWYQQLPLFFQARKLARLGLIKTLEETGQRALRADKFPAATYGLIMKNLADWRDINKNEAKDLPRPQVVVVLPEQRRQISEADIIDIKPREVRQLDFADVG